MKNKAYKNAQLKRMIVSARKAGKKELELNITEEQAEFLRGMGCYVKEYLYRIPTRFFKNPEKQKGIIRELHNERKKGKLYIKRVLKSNEIKVLREHGIIPYVILYKIIIV